MSLSIAVLAAGRGTRMNSSLPKVLHRLSGKPLLSHVIDTAEILRPKQILVVVGFRADEVIATCSSSKVGWVYQDKQLGTGDAVAKVLPKLASDVDRVLVLAGDVPMVCANMLERFIQATPINAVGIVTTYTENPYGLGRVIRKGDTKSEVSQIIEEIDASDEQKKIQEVSAGIYLVPRDKLTLWLPSLSNANNSGEYYLPQIIQRAVESKVLVAAFVEEDDKSLQGINNQVQLALAEREYQYRRACSIMSKGVVVLDPYRLDIRGDTQFGRDVLIDVNVILEGDNVIGDSVSIGPNVIIKNSTIGTGTVIDANSIIECSTIGEDCTVGPFARLRPETFAENKVKIGNFVETKKTVIGCESKVNHLSYIGDAKVGCRVNVGAGTITCNYDGYNKYQTEIQDDVFIGSATQLIAPVLVGRGAKIAAGTTLMQDAPSKQLTLNRKIQASIDKRDNLE